MREDHFAISALFARVTLEGMADGLQTLVTGVSGYVGAELVPRLIRDGHRVRGFARSADRVRAAGRTMVMNRCPAIEWPRLGV